MGTEKINLTENARVVLEKRYLAKDSNGKVIETPETLIERVSNAIAKAELKYVQDKSDDWAKKFYDMISELKFLPNSPTLMNAGRELGQLSACFVLPVEDSMEGIFDSIKSSALIHKSGGGTGFSFSRLRPKGAMVKSTGGVASGPISFMKVFNAATEAVKQGGCVDENTRIATVNGLIKIKELGPCDLPEDSWHKYETPLKLYTDEGVKEADEFYVHGKAKVKKISTECGYSVCITHEHRLRVIDSDGNYIWKHAKDIKKGDWLALKKNTYPEITDYRLPDFEYESHFNAKEITLPQEPSEDLGEFIGYFIGDGSFSFNERGTGRVIFSVADDEPEVFDRIISLGNKLFSIEPVINKKPGDKSSNLFYNSTVLAHWLKHIGVDKVSSMDVKVPEIAFRAGVNFATGFLRGLFSAYGTVSKEGYVTLYSISKELVDGVRELLLSLGIPSRTIINIDRQDSLGKNPIYRLNLITQEGYVIFRDRIGFISTAKNDRLEVIDNRALEFNDIIPNQQQVFAKIYDGPGKGCGHERMDLGANWELYRDIQHYLPKVAAPRNLNRSRLSYLAEKYPEVAESPLKWFLENNQFYDRVETVEDDEAFTLDLSVPDNNTYIAAGFISHNTRRGANMGILRVDHPDILDFIQCKKDDKEITNFNISVAITDKFMEALKADGNYDLIDPHTKKPTGKLRAREVFDLIVDMAWNNGEPGIVFIDRMNEDNPTPAIGDIESTNPCGEQPLLPYESCNLGSINLAKFIKKSGNKNTIDYESLKETVHLAVRFLDDVIDVNLYPLKEIEEMTKANRKIGLGVMGFADMLIELGIPYNSDEAVKTAEAIMSFIDNESKNASCELAKERGVFPNWEKSIYKEKGMRIRNATTTTIAPTGTISIIAGVSSGIEPIFALAFERHVMDNQRLVEVHPIFKQILKEQGLYSEELMQKVVTQGTLQGIDELPEEIKRVFVTAHDIKPEWHIKMQAAFQKYTDNAVSKTVNFPNSATREDVKTVYMMAYNLGCKGVTIYRDGSRQEQVLNKGTKKERPARYKIKPRPRPSVTYGNTEKVKIGCGNLYITVNSDENGICEVFTNLGRAGGCPSQSEATSRLISMALRSGIDVKAIVEQLKGIRCHSTLRQMANNKDIKVLSCPDAIGRAIERSIGENVIVNGNGNGSNEAYIKRYLDTDPEATVTPEDGSHNPNPTKKKVNGGTCPECGHGLEHEGGCVICRSCGYSKCG